MRLFKCHHNWKITRKSNVLQVDSMGYPLRLCIVKCTKCSKSDQHWVFVPEKELDEIATGKSVLLKWYKN